MATGNFYESGNHGLNVVTTETEFDLTDTIDNIVGDLEDKGYSVQDIRMDSTPRSFDTGMAYTVFNKNNKVVAVLEVCAGYYSDANINVYTDVEAEIEYDRDEITHNKRDINRVVKIVKLYTTQYAVTARFSNGETMYAKV